MGERSDQEDENIIKDENIIIVVVSENANDVEKQSDNSDSSDESDGSDRKKRKHEFEEICQICLCNDRKLYKITTQNLLDFYENITNVEAKWKGEPLPQQNMLHACWECNARLSSFASFSAKAIHAKNLLSSLNLPNISEIDREAHNLTSNLETKHFQANYADYNFVYSNNEDDVKNVHKIELPDLALPESSDYDDTLNYEDYGETKAEKMPYLAIHDHDDTLNYTDYGEMKVENMPDLAIDDDDDDTLNYEDYGETKVENMPELAIDDDDTLNYTDYGEMKVEKLPDLPIDDHDYGETKVEKKKIKKVDKPFRPASEVLNKVDKRFRPANEVLNNDIFNITGLSVEEQMNEIQKRKFSSNYENSGFKCNECFKGFLDEDAYKRHMIRHTEQGGVYKCTICNIRFKKLTPLTNHKASHMQKFSCKRCNFVTFRRHAARLHEKFHDGTTYVCPHCRDCFDKLSSYWGHIRRKHPSDIICELCGYSFVSTKGLSYHKKVKHEFDDQQATDGGPWCSKCDIQFISKEALERHIQKSTKHSDEPKPVIPNPRPHYALQDSIKTENNAEEKKERSTRKVEGPISCEQCEMQLPDPLSYFRHFRRMHPDKNRTNYPSMNEASKTMCEVCGKMFQSLGHLQDHSWTHTDVKQFKCSVCDKQFVRRSRLLFHQRLHRNPKGNHKCTVCSKAFTTASNMQRHMVVHTGLKPFQCEMCGKCFALAIEKRTHITYVHLKKPWPKRNRGKRKEE